MAPRLHMTFLILLLIKSECAMAGTYLKTWFEGTYLKLSFITKPDRSTTVQRGNHENSSLGLNTEDVRTK